MLGTDKQAGSEDSRRDARETDEARASLFALPRPGARQRLLAGRRTAFEETGLEEPAPVAAPGATVPSATELLRPASGPVAAPHEVAPSAAPSEPELPAPPPHEPTFAGPVEPSPPAAPAEPPPRTAPSEVGPPASPVEPAPVAALSGLSPVPASRQPPAVETESGAGPLLYSKGTASASGFRPWYWSYERDGRPPPSDSAGTVTPFPASAPSPVSPPDPVSALATPSSPVAVPTDPPALPQRAPVASPRSRFAPARAHAAPSRFRPMPLLLAGIAVLALALAGGGFFLLSRSEERAEMPVALTAPLVSAPIPADAETPAPKPAELAPQPRSSTTSASPSAQETAALIGRGDQLLATGDIAAARLFYERAAEGGSAAAATAVGKTYDPFFLADSHARGIRGDPVAAARWYRKASAAGDREADALMQRLMTKYAG